MSKFDYLLKYQEIDLKMRRHEMNNESNEDYKRAKIAMDQFNAAKKTSEDSEAKAGETVAYFGKLGAHVAEMESRAGELEKIVPTPENLDKLKESVDKIVKNAQKIESDIDIINRRATEIPKVHDESVKKGRAAKEVFNRSKQKYVTAKAAEDAEIAKYRAELDKIEPTIEPALLERYKSLRKDKVFPAVKVIDAKTDSMCACNMEISMRAKSRLIENGSIECEYCHRLLVSK